MKTEHRRGGKGAEEGSSGRTALRIVRVLPAADQRLREQVLGSRRVKEADTGEAPQRRDGRRAAQPSVSETERLSLVAEIDAVAASVAGCYRQLPPATQATALQLGHSLSSLRRALLS